MIAPFTLFLLFASLAFAFIAGHFQSALPLIELGGAAIGLGFCAVINAHLEVMKSAEEDEL